MRSFLVLALLCPALWGQGSVTIFGTVRDSSAAVVPQTEVAVRMPATGLIRKTVTDASGVYTFSALPNGELSIEITAQGFKSAQAAQARHQRARNSPLPPSRSESVVRVP